MIRYILPLLLIYSSNLLGQNDRTQVLLETSKGKIVLELYNETPHHRDNFLQKVQSGTYDGVRFHRVIKDFVIQGGNVNSKNLAKGQELEDDSAEGVIDAELRPELFIHERGALAAARQSDEVNPERRSSATQFYIVTGRYYTAFDLDEVEAKHGYKYTAPQREAYMHRGGTPSLDGAYTVFGRIIVGWSVVDKIQRVPTNDEDSPEKAVFIKKASVFTPKK